MIESLLMTKLYIPPPHPDLVPRPRLVRRLEEGLRLGRRLTLLSAPAGYGKSTLLSAWIASHRRGVPQLERRGAGASTAPLQVAWLSLDREDDSPARFWTYLVAALQSVHAGLGQEALQLLGAPGALDIRFF